MNNSDERDYAEEEYNRRTCPECDMQHEKDESCIVPMSDESDLSNQTDKSYNWWETGDYHTMDESAREVEDRLPVGYGDEWDGSSRNQSNDFFIGHSGHVTILWHVTNNPFEKYDSSKSYHMPALDGSALYVWCELKFTDHQALLYIEHTAQQLSAIGDSHTMTKFIS